MSDSLYSFHGAFIFRFSSIPIDQKSAKAVVTNGKARDIEVLKRENYPVWCSGFNPVGCFNRDPSTTLSENNLLKQRQEYFRDSVIVCDDTGALLITKDYLNTDFIGKLEWINRQEQIWQECIEEKNWDTFVTICLKQYLQE